MADDNKISLSGTCSRSTTMAKCQIWVNICCWKLCWQSGQNWWELLDGKITLGGRGAVDAEGADIKGSPEEEGHVMRGLKLGQKLLLWLSPKNWLWKGYLIKLGPQGHWYGACPAAVVPMDGQALMKWQSAPSDYHCSCYELSFSILLCKIVGALPRSLLCMMNSLAPRRLSRLT